MRKKYLIQKLEGTRDLLNTAELGRSGLRTELSKLKVENQKDIESVIKVLGISGYEDKTEEYMDSVFNFGSGRYDNVLKTRTNYGANRFLKDIREAVKAVDGKAALKRIKAAQNV